MKDHKITMLMILFFFIGLLVFFYPTLSNYYNEKNQSRTIYNYENILKNTNQIDFEKVKNDAIEYNKKLSKLKEPLLTYDTLKNYKKLLNVNDDGMMGYLTIDKIKVELPIYHTVSETVLNSSVGHLEGTSLPIGGKGTHSVLSAHRGLPSAKLFTELDKLEIGDTFKITILDETHVYKVDKISIVKPNDRNELKIDKDNDYVTLLTCTPYGINTHRLLVRGVRVQGDIKKDYITTEGFKVNRLIVMPIIALPIIALLLIVLLIALMSVGCSNKNSQQSSQTTPESSQTSEKNLTIEDVEGYWECKSDEEGILLKLGWKNDIDLYYSDGSKEKNSYNIIDSDSNSIEIEMRDEDKITNIIIKSDDNGETITLKRNKKEHYFIRIPKDKFYVKLIEDYGGE